MQTQVLLGQLAARLEIADLVPDENGECEINFDGSYRVQLVPDGKQRLRLQARVGQLASDPIDRETQLRRQLRRVPARQSLEGAGTETLTVDEDADAFVIYKILPADELHVEELCQHVESFVNAAAYWSDAGVVQENRSWLHALAATLRF